MITRKPLQLNVNKESHLPRDLQLRKTKRACTKIERSDETTTPKEESHEDKFPTEEEEESRLSLPLSIYRGDPREENQNLATPYHHENFESSIATEIERIKDWVIPS